MREITVGYDTFLVTVRLIIDWRGRKGRGETRKKWGCRPFAVNEDAVNGAEKGVKFNVR